MYILSYVPNIIFEENFIRSV